MGKICQMRELKDKKGGGLLMLYELGGGILVEKIDCPYSDILVTGGDRQGKDDDSYGIFGYKGAR